MYNRRIVLATSLLAPISLAATIPSNLIYRQALSLASDLPASWSYKGCFIDPMANRTLKKASRSTTDMTGTSCLTWCASRGFNIAGTEWSSEVNLSACLTTTATPMLTLTVLLRIRSARPHRRGRC